MIGVSKRRVSVVLTILVCSLFALQFVSAATVASDIKDFFTSIFNLSAESGASSLVMAKILLFILVALIVYAVSEFVPFLENRGPVAALIAIVVGILSVFFLKSEEIYTVLISYGAFGIAVTIIIPLILVGVISSQLYNKQYILASKLVWIVYLLAIILKFLAADSDQIGTFGLWLFGITIPLALIMAIWSHKIYFFIFKEQIRNASVVGEAEALAEITAKLTELQAEIIAAPSDAAAAPLIAKYDRLAKRSRELGGKARNWRK